MSIDLSRLVRSRSVLQRSWGVVRSSGLSSRSAETQRKTKEFDANSLNNIERIIRKLRNGTFRFSNELGVALRKAPGKHGHRPLVVAPIENRIVRRAILEVLQGYDSASPHHRKTWSGVSAIREIMETPTSVGGIAGRGVPYGLSLIDSAIKAGHHRFIRSDIRDFFTRIPLEQINNFVRKAVQEDAFCNLFSQALETNLANKEELEERKHFTLFPTNDIGVAQGSALSALAGNIILHTFDVEMNGRGIVCVRYIDDFILLGTSEKNVAAAFRSAQMRLSQLGMSAYDIDDEKARRSGKVDSGNIHDGTNVLGYRISAGSLQPSSAAKKALLEKIDRIILEAKHAMSDAAAGKPHSRARLYHHALTLIDRTVWGWSQAFKYANVEHALQSLDTQIDERIFSLQNTAHQLTRDASPLAKRRINGIHLVQNTYAFPLPELSP
ncbi:MAG: reverse transcriptase domain-containing protein [Bradyrhizobium sp.]|uniref:reverse transcriptase domain-containing protein n=1 Tax=Bradyrhizobium sp. TaxID=376 RepID=UPI003C7ABCEA